MNPFFNEYKEHCAKIRNEHNLLHVEIDDDQINFCEWKLWTAPMRDVLAKIANTLKFWFDFEQNEDQIDDFFSWAYFFGLLIS